MGPRGAHQNTLKNCHGPGWLPRSPKQITLTHESAIKREKQTLGGEPFRFCPEEEPSLSPFFLRRNGRCRRATFSRMHSAPAVRGHTLGTPDADAKRGVGIHIQ